MIKVCRVLLNNLSNICDENQYQNSVGKVQKVLISSVSGILGAYIRNFGGLMIN